MSEAKIPSTYNGEPTGYTFFDGFTKAGLGMKVLYVLGFPAISIIMEGYRYNKAKNNARAAEEAMGKLQAESAAKSREQPAPAVTPDLNPNAPEPGTNFQEVQAQRRSNAATTERTV